MSIQTQVTVVCDVCGRDGYLHRALTEKQARKNAAEFGWRQEQVPEEVLQRSPGSTEIDVCSHHGSLVAYWHGAGGGAVLQVQAPGPGSVEEQAEHDAHDPADEAGRHEVDDADDDEQDSDDREDSHA